MIALTVVALLLSGTPAEAHNDWALYYPHRWQSSIYTPGVWLYSNPGFTATEVSRIRDGIRKWNDLAPTLWINYKGSGLFSYRCSSPRNRNTIAYGNVDGPYGEGGNRIARTFFCFDDAGGMDRFWTIIDFDEIWYTDGDNCCILEDQYDFMSVVTHEAGHELAFSAFPRGESWPKHFTDSKACPSTRTSWSTMCSPQKQRETFWRSLGSHDVHTYDLAY